MLRDSSWKQFCLMNDTTTYAVVRSFSQKHTADFMIWWTCVAKCSDAGHWVEIQGLVHLCCRCWGSVDFFADFKRRLTSVPYVGVNWLGLQILVSVLLGCRFQRWLPWVADLWSIALSRASWHGMHYWRRSSRLTWVADFSVDGLGGQVL